ncbi:hypothetical protein SEA_FRANKENWEENIE_160 [Streptomyces phage Frankenweenie]|nr:hypothetical protein SEA_FRANKENWEENIE_160 [Streptomyces phage Frankenweenie]
MPSRDQRLAATKYAGKKSASQAAREKTSRRSTPPPVAEDPMEGMRRALAQPRSQESIDRAHAHQRNLPPLP